MACDQSASLPDAAIIASQDSAATDAVVENPDANSCADMDLATDPEHCGACGHSCLGGACLQGVCQPIALIDTPLPNADKVYAWSLATAGNHVYYTDNIISKGRVWRIGKLGGGVEPMIPGPGQNSVEEYCLGAFGSGERARWLTSRDGHVHWVGCLGRIRDLETSSGQVNRLGEFELGDYGVQSVFSTQTHLFGIRNFESEDEPPIRSGEIISFDYGSGTTKVLARYNETPRFVAVDNTHAFWTGSPEL
jgi:hypothetical protein